MELSPRAHSTLAWMGQPVGSALEPEFPGHEQQRARPALEEPCSVSSGETSWGYTCTLGRASLGQLGGGDQGRSSTHQRQVLAGTEGWAGLEPAGTATPIGWSQAAPVD